MYGYIGIFGGRGDGERMPLEFGNVGDLEEDPLTGGILEARLDHAEFHCTRGVNEDLVEFGSPASTDFTPDSFAEVEDTGPDDSTPREVTNANIGVVKGKGVRERGECGSTDKASGGVGVETDHEEKGEMMRVPECLEALLADLLMCGTVHDDHDEEHEMTSDSSGLLVVNVEGVSGTDLCSRLEREYERCKEALTTTFDIDKVDIMSSGMNHSPKRHGISDLTMEPNVLVCREQPSHTWTNDTDDIPEHGDENEETIDGEY